MSDTAVREPPVQQAPVTTRALAELGMDALDRGRVDKVQVSAVAGGVSFASALEVMEFAKLMAVAGKAVPSHLRNNPGACLAITFQAVEWHMSPFAVANKSYEVNDRIAYESQLLHAVIESRAPLKGRLRCDYEGEGPTRVCVVRGTFVGEPTPHEYRSPMFKDIRIKNSPLWKDDPDQQLFYYASRSWARRWAPDVLLGIYTRDELDADPQLGREEQPNDGGLSARLAGSSRPGDEGHREGYAASELANIAPAREGVTILPADKDIVVVHDRNAKAGTDQPEQSTETDAPKKNAKNRKRAAKGEQAAPQEPSTPEKQEPPKQPTTAAEYEAYADAWIDAATDYDNAEARWDGEGDQRHSLSVPIKVRNRLHKKIDVKFGRES